MSSRQVDAWSVSQHRRPDARAHSADKTAYLWTTAFARQEPPAKKRAESFWEETEVPACATVHLLPRIFRIESAPTAQIAHWLWPIYNVERRFAPPLFEDAVETAWESALESLKAALTVEVDPARRAGVPVLRGTRFPVSRLFAELADDRTLSDIADDYDLDLDLLRKVVEAVAVFSDRLPGK